jgi:hypothetical protein
MHTSPVYRIEARHLDGPTMLGGILAAAARRHTSVQAELGTALGVELEDEQTVMVHGFDRGGSPTLVASITISMGSWPFPLGALTARDLRAGGVAVPNNYADPDR